jgi:hypothetical protein
MGFAIVSVGYIAPTVMYTSILQQTNTMQKKSLALDREKSHLVHSIKNLEHLAKQNAKTTLNMQETLPESIKQIVIK